MGKESSPPKLVVPKEEARRLLTQQIEAGKALLQIPIHSVESLREVKSKFINWSQFNAEVLGRIFETDYYMRGYNYYGVVTAKPSFGEKVAEVKKDIGDKLRKMESTLERLEIIPEADSVRSLTEQKGAKDPIQILETLFSRFHAVARQLLIRQKSRAPFKIGDEYDVQDLLHALLRLHFNNIKAEDFTPDYAGGKGRTDFVLPDHNIIIEAKKTRKGLEDKEVGEQLSIDLVKYRSHLSCKTLLCFVYDPEGRIRNPASIIAELSKDWNGVDVKVYIYPDHT